MLTPNRKTFQKITESGLRKCTVMYTNGVHAYCTPAEYIALVHYFESESLVRDIEYYKNKVRKGECSPTNHYIQVRKWRDLFPKDKYFINCGMSTY